MMSAWIARNFLASWLRKMLSSMAPSSLSSYARTSRRPNARCNGRMGRLLATHTDAVLTHTREEPRFVPSTAGSRSDCKSNSGHVTAFLQAERLLWITLQPVLVARFPESSLLSQALDHANVFVSVTLPFATMEKRDA